LALPLPLPHDTDGVGVVVETGVVTPDVGEPPLLGGGAVAHPSQAGCKSM